ncbi:C6 transcription factor [Penicillium malachiteum]|uniref:C6 transcription factor n=1 Tax=Penicillium malachiteum TaxID=1324776 RepID=UPI002546BAAD|nr:C6 transcription factor [Penicillium malachiteum]KAJ5713136.1 C6 transcription factor [Penicillium malachiteum]
MQPARLEEMGLVLFDHCVEFFYEKTIECLNDAKFMENHNIFTVQAICLLTYIGHHIGQSNRMSVLVAAAIRIAQCLGLHRLGPDKKLADPALNRQKLHRREVSKRVWWFLVRQDWLQIPVSNTCNIHPRQFDTPMPDGNCLIADGQAIDRNMIQGGYTSVLNKAAFIVWRFHDSVTSNEESSRKVYSEVLKADNQLRKLMNDIPFYLRQESPEDGMKHQSALLYLELAQQFYSIHRFFQISSLKDPNFAYTKISCSPFMYRNLFTFLSLEKNNPSTQIVSYLWTSNTHVLTAALWLLFEMIFSKEGMAQIYEAAEIRELAAKTFEFLRANERESKVAKRGGYID